ncbi:MAG TPA: hypothetical protein VMX77_00365, partial [Candidatus Bathyarchaeia archaeon]|nr:hypothetical protein [Candidatus Bathyarchaeia archaeon]
VEVENEGEVTNEIDSTALTGENSIESPEPTPTIALVATASASPEATQSAAEETPTPTPSPEPVVIETGDTLSVVEAENSVNTTEVNSQVLYQTLNIFVPQDGDLDLSITSLAIAENVFVQNNHQEPVVNVAVIDNQSFAYLSNEIVSLADTGQNLIEEGEEAVINTGDAYSIVSLLNKVNTTMIDSTIHVLTINIFGGVDGNLLLPEFSDETGCCGGVVKIENKAEVENSVTSSAITGQNLITTNESGTIITGDASSAVNLVNIVNTSFVDATFRYLFINTFGYWLGDFVGLDDLEASAGGGNLSLSSTSSGGSGSCSTCSDAVLIDNKACVVNNVSSEADTGGNSISGGEGKIETGNAYSAVSIINFVNSSFIRSFGFLGFVNIFGFLNGDIGGASLFATSQEPVVENTSSDQEESGSEARQEGGLLEVSLTHNVGTHVFPGDTITFFAVVKNPGTGRVYDAQVMISLIKDGVDMGGGTFDLGDIDAGKGVKLTTGLVLSEESAPGDYLAQAVVTGYVGPDDQLISASAETPFKIGAGSSFPLAGVQEVEETGGGGETLGAIAASSGMTQEQKLWVLLFGSLGAYFSAKGYQRRRELAGVLSASRGFIGARSAAFRSFLMSLASFLS